MIKKAAGEKGENLAASFLKRKGYRILDRNFKGRFGEIDIVAQDGETLVFVEVKSRFSRRFGPPEEAVTLQKINSITKTGYYYKLLHPELPESLRIDVVAIDLSPAEEGERIRLIRNVTR